MIKDIIRIIIMLMLIIGSMIIGMIIMGYVPVDYHFTIPWFIGFINFPMVYYMGIGYENKKDEKKD